MYNQSRNKNARISSRMDRTGKVRTETVRRDPGELTVALSTEPNVDSTRLFVNFGGDFDDSIELTGHQARTLYLTLQRHFQALGKTW